MTEWIYDPRAGRCRKTDGGQTMSDIDDCRKFVENLTRDRGEVMRAGDDKIAEIRARHSATEVYQQSLTDRVRMHNDCAFLLAEVERHRAENERLRKAMTNMMIGWRHIRREREEYRAEVERLKREPELLRAELISLANAARKALADAYDRAKEVRDAFQQKGP